MDNQNANGGFSPNPANFPGQFGSYDPNAGQQTISSGQLNPTQNAPIDPTTGVVMPQANYGQAIIAPVQEAQNPAPATPEPTIAPRDQLAEQRPEDKVIVDPNLINLQTKSLVESQRESSADELAKANAYAEELKRQERIAARQKTAKRAGIYAALGIFGLAFLGVVGFLLLQILNTSKGGVQTGGVAEEQGEVKYNVIDGYQCKTDKCARMDDLPDGRILLRDEGYIIYNKQDSTSTSTTIEDQDYNSIKSFTWGSKIYAVVDPVSDRSGLYSISDNRMVVGYQYDTYYTDVNNEEIYGDMAWVTDQYIIASTSSPKEYSVVDLLSGQSILRGGEHVFMNGGFLFGYEANGERRVYAPGSSSAFLVAPAGDALFVRDSILIYYAASGNVRYYNTSGQTARTSDIGFWEEIRRINRKELLAFLNGNSKYYKIPTFDAK